MNKIPTIFEQYGSGFQIPFFAFLLCADRQSGGGLGLSVREQAQGVGNTVKKIFYTCFLFPSYAS